jgi:hypothetical protein
MRKMLSIGIAVVGLMALLASPSFARDDEKPDATLRMSEGSVAVGIGWSWGRGELTYKGQTYKFKIEGVSVAEVGMTNAKATGNVYNLKSLDDFAGGYAAAGTAGTAGKGVGVSSLRNDKGVVINLKSETKGANLKLAASGLKITLEK